MKRRTFIIVLLCILLLALGFAVRALSAPTHSKQPSGEPGVAAVYHDHVITIEALEYHREMRVLYGTADKQKPVTDRELVDELVTSIVLLEEAERRGIAVTDEDVAALVNNTREVYADPEGRKPLDDYCAAAGITIEQYFENLEEQAPRTIARQRVKDAIGNDYCEAHGIPFTKVNPPAEMEQAVSKELERLLQTARKDIVYYVD